MEGRLKYDWAHVGPQTSHELLPDQSYITMAERRTVGLFIYLCGKDGVY
jgi:hypothetical protein